jgi:hypothetical protein
MIAPWSYSLLVVTSGKFRNSSYQSTPRLQSQPRRGNILNVYNSWLKIQRSGFDSRRYQIFWEVVGLERGPLSLVSTTEELLGRESNGSGLETREYGHIVPSRWPRDTFHPQNLALTSPTNRSRSVGVVPSRTEAMEFSSFSLYSRRQNAPWSRHDLRSENLKPYNMSIKIFLQVGAFYSLDEYYKWKTRDDCASYR